MKNYHFCISSDNEILFRTETDYIRGFNTLALSLSETGSLLSAEAFMSTHLHVCVRTDDINSLINRFWRSYTRYFNTKYRRKGTLGGQPFILEIGGFHHWLTAICYVLRNPVHHGVAPTPFAYRHCSANSIFREQTGKMIPAPLLPRKSYYKYLPKGTVCPPQFLMDQSGMILRETVVDVADVEHRFSTPRSYLFYMNRLTSEEWQREQEKDTVSANRITLDVIELLAHNQSLSEMLKHEHGRSDYRAMTDHELCEKIDLEIVGRFGKKSVYELSPEEKQQIMKAVRLNMKVPDRQVSRCLAIGLSSTV